MKRKIKAWWFCDRDCRLRYGDRRIAKVGTMHEIEESPILCECGFHGSRDIVDALRLGYGPICWRIELSGEIVAGTDKLVAQRRTYLWKVDAETLLRKFNAARAAAWAAARDVAWDAASAAASAAASDEASAAASDEAGDEARAAAWDAAWDAANKKQSRRLERMIREAHSKEAR